MSETDTETTLCAACAVPVDVPKKTYWGPFLVCPPVPRCKDCLLKEQIEDFTRQHLFVCPYKTPHWRPRR